SLRFSNGAVGSINNSRRTGFSYDQRVEVMGTKATAFGGNEQPSRASWIDPAGSHSDVPLYFNMERYPAAFLGEMEGFVGCIQNDAPPPATGHDGRTAVALSIAAQKSHDEHRPVKLSEIG
ncbi:MAG TPA: Gfo/Idh/MocA family oxidoreductase, partial [Alkalispirochaeta sp.]|nr:Gfo/Idh/MocA family oxidoreductase [Alkalispirochaeta sp.]